ncbi:protein OVEREXPRESSOR OF CATIONIC PEROXIDASE 3 isoform X2 [Ricinus communis]|uniref:protein OVEREXPRESSOR OF CATIONIC PEROXIDASE 3 isoform X2 n=1 Tax=Ricinus communis TaxID=3988 RepID=UPI00201AB660|nr:protein OVEREXPRESSOR OF CATIONIC PEROXIDASE 3 isoform X2 [Ricinus communis]
MAFALSSSLKSFTGLRCLPHSDRFFSTPSTLLLPRHSLSTSVLTLSRRRNRNSQTSSSKPKKKKSSFVEYTREEDEEMNDDDALETLFNMLEEDLKNDKSLASDDDDDDISEEDFEKLQRELEAALGIGEDENDEDVNLLSSDAHDVEHENIEDDDEEEERPVKVKNWQMRRLARTLKNGRRRTSIKSLAAELCLDRAIVLELLRDPPPNLVMMSAALRDEPESTPLMAKAEPIEVIPMETSKVDDMNSESEKKVPVHVMRHSWTAQKRLKKNAMISSIVQVTNLPRKKVVKWFEDKRNEDGVPEQRLPYQRSAPEAVSSC